MEGEGGGERPRVEGESLEWRGVQEYNLSSIP